MYGGPRRRPVGGAQEEVLLHFVQRGVVRVLHPNHIALPIVDTGDNAHLRRARVRHAGEGPNDGCVGTHCVFPPPPPTVGPRVALLTLVSLHPPFGVGVSLDRLGLFAPPPHAARDCLNGLGLFTLPLLGVEGCLDGLVLFTSLALRARGCLDGLVGSGGGGARRSFLLLRAADGPVRKSRRMCC